MKARWASLAGIVATVVGVAGFVIICDHIQNNGKKWLEKNALVAEVYAKNILAGQDTHLPSPLASSVSWSEARSDCVYFVLGGGPLSSKGIAYSPSDQMPTNGLAGELRIIKWRRIRDHWFQWVAE